MWPLPEVAPVVVGKEGRHQWVIAQFHRLTDKEAKNIAKGRRGMRLGRHTTESFSAVGCLGCGKTWDQAHGTRCPGSRVEG